MNIRELPEAAAYRVATNDGTEALLQPLEQADLLPTLRIANRPDLVVGQTVTVPLRAALGVPAAEALVAFKTEENAARLAQVPCDVAYKGGTVDCLLPTPFFQGTITTPSGPMAWAGPMPWAHHLKGTIEVGTPKVRVGIE